MYFDIFKTEDEVKTRYRMLSKRLHPDMGGDAVIMAEINTEYERFIVQLKTNEPPKSKPREQYKPKWATDFDPSHKDKIEMIYDWAEDNDFFDLSFVNSLSIRLDSGRGLSPNQAAALEKIIERFNIGKP